jgi:hypothetical protein
MSTRSDAVALRPDEAAQTRRNFLLLLAAGAAWLWSVRALGQTELDENGNPIRLPGQTPTPDTRARERGAVEQQRNRAIEDRTRERDNLQLQQQQQNRNDAIQRELNVQRNFDQQRLDILNNRDKP